MEENKSILNGVPVDDRDWRFMRKEDKLKAENKEAMPKVRQFLPVVSSCPYCGNPIHGRREILEGDAPIVVRTCSCGSQQSFQDTIQTKEG